ncbi:MAG: hypothetical protein IKG39_01795 [Lachnospiraceae bacterium]|nr:hypothetical protein [Lachnospiraceae bacterium]
MLNVKNTYWNGEGLLQKEYDEIKAAVYNSTYTLTKEASKLFYSYYHFYNDCTPARYRYNEAEYQSILESRMNDRIKKEYLRFIKTFA